MRNIVIATLGFAVIAGSLTVSGVSSGFLGAAAFLFAVFLVPVLVGIGLAAGVEAWSNRTRPSRLDHWLGRDRARSRCGGCGKRRVKLDIVWFCPLCDIVAADR